MAHNSNLNQKKGAHRHASPDDPYCSFKNDRERRNALVSRDLRIFGCRLVITAAITMFAIYAPPGSTLGLVARLLGRL